MKTNGKRSVLRAKVELVELGSSYEIRLGGQIVGRYANWRTSEARAFAAGVRAALKAADEADAG